MMVAYDNQNIQTKQGNDEGLTLNKLLIFFAFCRIYKPCFYWSNEALPNPQAKKKKNEVSKFFIFLTKAADITWYKSKLDFGIIN